LLLVTLQDQLFEAALAMLFEFGKRLSPERAFFQMLWLQLATSCRVRCNMTACLAKTQQSRQLAYMLQRASSSLSSHTATHRACCAVCCLLLEDP
jgi:hypothetical protein